MTTQALKKTVDRDRLAAYGIPVQLINTFDRMSKQGAFDEEPPEELLERTLQACLHQVTEAERVPLIFPMQRFRSSVDPVVTSGFYEADPPVVHLRHHALRHLDIWDSSEFTSVRAICSRLAESGGPAPLQIEVLRDPATYTGAEGEILWRQYKEDPCDIVWAPESTAAALGIRDIIVAEPMGVFTLHESPSNAKIAIQMYLKSQQSDPAIAYETREKLLGLKTVSVKQGGVFDPRFTKYFSDPQGVIQAISEVYAAEFW